jgi:hypothetical protein
MTHARAGLFRIRAGRTPPHSRFDVPHAAVHPLNRNPLQSPATLARRNSTRNHPCRDRQSRSHPLSLRQSGYVFEQTPGGPQDQHSKTPSNGPCVPGRRPASHLPHHTGRAAPKNSKLNPPPHASRNSQQLRHLQASFLPKNRPNFNEESGHLQIFRTGPRPQRVSKCNTNRLNHHPHPRYRGNSPKKSASAPESRILNPDP